jgi:hypothetical protein
LGETSTPEEGASLDHQAPEQRETPLKFLKELLNNSSVGCRFAANILLGDAYDNKHYYFPGSVRANQDIPQIT